MKLASTLIYLSVYVYSFLLTPGVFASSPPSLNGAKTIQVIYKVFTEEGCEIDRPIALTEFMRQLRKLDDIKINEYNPEKHGAPHLVGTLLIETRYVPIPGCQYSVNFRVVSPFWGDLPYNKNSQVIQALVYNKSSYSIVLPAILTEAVKIQSAKSAETFNDKYRSHNN